jgi:hypothetical protein
METDDVALLRPGLEQALTELVNATRPREVVEAVLRLGTPGGEHLTFHPDPTFDSGLWADVIERALDGFDLDAGTPVAWMTRAGALAPGDLDFVWFGAIRDGFARHGLPLVGFFVMTQQGWFDLSADTEVTLLQVRRRRRRRKRSA